MDRRDRWRMSGIADREYHKVAPLPSTGRPSIYDLREPQADLGVFLDASFDLPRDGRVLDAGCGPGQYLPPLRARVREVVALDIAHVRGPEVVGDVQALPFPDDSFDAVLAMHMLYHVPDIPVAVAELRRVLRADGVLYALTNSERAQWELLELVRRNGGDAAGFSNESGGQLLATAFDAVELVEFTDTQLVVRDAECVVDELQRLRYALEPSLVDAPWDAFVVACRRDAQVVIDQEGAFRMGERHGLFTCR
jgi:SAM-dependent methyltransferase